MKCSGRCVPPACLVAAPRRPPAPVRSARIATAACMRRRAATPGATLNVPHCTVPMHAAAGQLHLRWGRGSEALGCVVWCTMASKEREVSERCAVVGTLGDVCLPGWSHRSIAQVCVCALLCRTEQRHCAPLAEPRLWLPVRICVRNSLPACCRRRPQRQCACVVLRWCSRVVPQRPGEASTVDTYT